MSVGAGYWLTDATMARTEAEAIAKATYAATRDPSDVALFYMGLGRKPLLQVCFSHACLASLCNLTFSCQIGICLALSDMTCHVQKAKRQLQEFFDRAAVQHDNAFACRVSCAAHSKSNWQIFSIETSLKPRTRRRHARTLLFFWVNTDMTWPLLSFCLVSQAPTIVEICYPAPLLWHVTSGQHIAVPWCLAGTG